MKDTSREASPRKSPRRATSLLFLVDGMGFGTWAALLPSLKQRLALTDAQLSGILLAMVLGAFVGMLFIGRIISRQGSHRVLAVLAPLFSLVLCVPHLAPGYLAVAGVAVIFGFLKGSFDVTVNSQAIAVENAVRRPIFATFQAWWSIGGLVAALFTGLALKAGLTPLLLTALLGAILLAISLICPRQLLNDAQPVSETAARRRSLFNPALISIGALAFAALFLEGVMMDWSAVYAFSVVGVAGWMAPMVYGTFCCAMAGGRLVGDALIARLTAVNVLRLSAFVAALGILLMIIVRHPVALFAGVLLTGFGVANLVPVFLGVAGRLSPEGAGRGVAAVSTIGYIGFLAGPPLVGGLSGSLGLPAAFLIVAVMAMVMGIVGPQLLNPRPTTATVALPDCVKSA